MSNEFLITHFVISFSREPGKPDIDIFDVNFLVSLMKPMEDTSIVSTISLEPTNVGVTSFSRFSYFFLLNSFDFSILSSWQIVNSHMTMHPDSKITAISGRKFLKIFEMCSTFLIPLMSAKILTEL